VPQHEFADLPIPAPASSLTRCALLLLLPLFLQLLRQLRRLHRLGIAHGDLKPENIMVKLVPGTLEICDIQISDWGAATFLDGSYSKEYMWVTPLGWGVWGGLTAGADRTCVAIQGTTPTLRLCQLCKLSYIRPVPVSSWLHRTTSSYPMTAPTCLVPVAPP
jgi:serine/threonine protein kinase